MRYKDIKTVETTVKEYFDKNPYIHLGVEALVNTINEGKDYDSEEYTMPVEIKIAALSLVSQGTLNLDKSWRLHKS